MEIIAFPAVILSVIPALHLLYMLMVGLFGFRKDRTASVPDKQHSFCSVIAARNEETVIADLIRSLRAQNYPEEKHDIYVLINNCTDRTEEIARSLGVSVFRCADPVKSKGDALRQFFDSPIPGKYEAFCFFDADNLVDPEFLNAMNEALCEGIAAGQALREAKSPGDSGISSCNALYFWVLSRFVFKARSAAGLSCFFWGTGSMIKRELLERIGLQADTLTEDLETSVQCILHSEKIAWIPRAVIYDEQPVRWKDSRNQRKRWSMGMIQCFRKYASLLFAKAVREKNMAAADTFFYLLSPYMQAMALSGAGITFLLKAPAIFRAAPAAHLLLMTAAGILFCSVLLAVIPALITGHQISDLHRAVFFTTWLYIVSWALINAGCLIKPFHEWKVIPHTGSGTLSRTH